MHEVQYPGFHGYKNVFGIGGGGGNGPTALNNSHVNLLYFIVLYFLDTQGTINISDPEFKLDIKISGDGAKMSLLISLSYHFLY